MTSSASNPVPANDPVTLPPTSMLHTGTIGRARLFIAAGICFALFYWAGGLFGVPTFRGYSASLLQQSSPIVALLLTAILIAVAVGVGSLIASSVHADAGILAAALGLIALSYRGGPMQYVLIAADRPGIYLLLALESLLLTLMLLVAWRLMRRWLVRGAGAADPILAGDTEDDSLNSRLLACAVQIIITILCMTILCRSDAKFQALASAAVSAWVGSVGAYLFFPVRPSPWYWVGPGIVAIVGYVFAYLGANDEWRIGIAAGPLANALPLDYLGGGVAGALVGCWSSRKWQHHREIEKSTDQT